MFPYLYLPRLLQRARQVLWDVSSQMPCQDTGLYEHQVANAAFLIEQGMTHHILLACLIGGNHRFAPCRSEFHSTSLAHQESLFGNLPTIDQGYRQALG